MRRIPTLLLAALLLLALPGAPARAGDEPTVLADRWARIEMGGQPAGTAHTVVRRVPADEGARIESREEQTLEMSRMGTALVIKVEKTTVETEDGHLVSVHSVRTMSGADTVVDVTFDGDAATIATTSMGQQRTAQVFVPEATRGPWHIERAMAVADKTPGSVFDAASFDTDLGGKLTIHVTMGPMEEVEDIAGAKQTLQRMEVRMEGVPMKTTAWAAKDGTQVRTVTMVGGMTIVTLAGTKEQVTGAPDPTKKPVEVFESTLVKTSQLIPHARDLDSALLVVRARNENADLALLTDERQRPEGKEADGALLLRITAQQPPAGHTGTRPLASPPAELATYLASSSMLQCDDPLIVAAMKEAVGEETDAWKAAQAIERWVFKAISKKNMGVAFASALEVCKNREGDCTEHAVLVVALCRAAGIPSRVAMGLEYLTGIFGGHAWAEVWIEGHWYGLDATLGVGHVDPLHLTLGHMAMAEGTYGAEFSSFLGLTGNLDVDVRETTWHGRTVDLRAPDLVVAEGSRYLNRLWGLALTAPAGYAVHPRGAAEGMTPQLVLLEPATSTSHGGALRVLADVVPGGRSLDSLAQAFARHGTLGEGTIDGRPARIGTQTRNGRTVHVAIVVDDVDSLFAFLHEPGEQETDEAWQTFLEGIDLDAEAPALPR